MPTILGEAHLPLAVIQAAAVSVEMFPVWLQQVLQARLDALVLPLALEFLQKSVVARVQQ